MGNCGRLSRKRYREFLDSGRFHPAQSGGFFGNVWLDRQPYIAYPGYHPTAGALGEYNGQFMCNQIVHPGRLMRDAGRPHPLKPIAISSRLNARWQFSGIRLAKEIAR